MRAWFLGAAALLLAGCLVEAGSSETGFDDADEIGVAEGALEVDELPADAPEAAQVGLSDPGADASGPEPDPWHDKASAPSNPEPDPWQATGIVITTDQPSTMQASTR